MRFCVVIKTITTASLNSSLNTNTQNKKDCNSLNHVFSQDIPPDCLALFGAWVMEPPYIKGKETKGSGTKLKFEAKLEKIK